MSTWTSNVRAAALWAAATLLLAGCLPAGLFPLAGPAAPVAAPPAAEGPLLLAGAVTVAAPTGWCPDPAAGLADETGGFVLFGPCRGAAAPAVPAILTLSVLGVAETGPVDPARLDTFFRSEVGRAALSRSGDPAGVSIVQTGVEGDAFVVQVRDAARLSGVAVAPDAWRAILPLNGRLVALTVLSPADPALPPATLRSVLDAFLAAMRAANGGNPATAG